MEKEIQLKELIIDDGQVEQFSFSIFKDIKEFIINNEDDYMSWFFGIPVDILNNSISTLNEGIIIIDDKYEYDLCNYYR